MGPARREVKCDSPLVSTAPSAPIGGRVQVAWVLAVRVRCFNCLCVGRRIWTIGVVSSALASREPVRGNRGGVPGRAAGKWRRAGCGHDADRAADGTVAKPSVVLVDWRAQHGSTYPLNEVSSPTMSSSNSPGAAAPLLNPAVRFYRFHERGRDDRWVCELKRADNSSFRYLVPTRIVTCLRDCDGTRPLDEILQRKGISDRQLVHVRNTIATHLIPAGVLLLPGSAGQHGLEAQSRSRTSASYLRARRRLLDGRTVATAVRYVCWLYRGPVVLCTLTVVAAVHWRVYLHSGGLYHLTDIQPAAGLTVLVVSLVGPFVHELGHATALVRHGGDNPEIGVGLYHVFPVMYTDVSDCWRMTRDQRVQVDIGGLYFQGMFVALVFLLGGMLGLPGCEAAVVWSNLLMVRTLNPFLRMDGYWLVNDLVGSTGIRQESRRVLRDMWRTWAVASATASWWGQVGRWHWIMAAYCVLSVGVFAALYARAVLMLVLYVVPDVIRKATVAVDAVRSGAYSVAVAEGGALVWHVAVGALICYAVGGFARRAVVKPLRRVVAARGSDKMA